MPDVVLADDSPTIRKVIELSFAGENLTLHFFPDGPSTLDYVRSHPVDVLLADALLPGVDGYDLCRELKNNRDTAHIPVVLLAGTFEPFDVSRAEKAGYYTYLTKPFETSQLVGLVRQLIDEQPAPKKETRTVNQKGLFTLTAQQCRPIPSLVRVDDLSGLEKATSEETPVNQTPEKEPDLGPKSASLGLSQADLDQVVSKVTERLSVEIRRIVVEVLQEVTRPQ